MEWLKENALTFIPLVAITFTGIGFLLRRWITGEHHRENLDSIEKAVQLKRLLDTENMTIDDAVVLRDRLRGAQGPLLRAEARAIGTREIEEAKAMGTGETFGSGEISFENTNVGMQEEAIRELKALEGEMDSTLADLAQVCSPARANALRKAQEAWELLRDKEAEFAALLFEGGSGASLLGLARKVELTEQRLADLRLARKEIRNLTGE